MAILEAALALFFATRLPAKPVSPPISLPVSAFGPADLAQTIKTDIESISGPGSVDVSVSSGTLFSVRVAVPSFRSEICTPIYDRELKLYRLFPDLNFDFYLRLKTSSAGQPRR